MKKLSGKRKLLLYRMMFGLPEIALGISGKKAGLYGRKKTKRTTERLRLTGARHVVPADAQDVRKGQAEMDRFVVEEAGRTIGSVNGAATTLELSGAEQERGEEEEG